MAKISKESRETIVDSGLRVQIPNTLFACRIVSAKTESKGKDEARGCIKRSLKTQVEILSPEEVSIGGGKSLDVAGLRFWLTPQRVEPETLKEFWAFPRVKNALDKSGFDWDKFEDGEWDDEKVGEHLVGHTMYINTTCAPRWLTRQLSEEERTTIASGGVVDNLAEGGQRVHQIINGAKAYDGYQIVADWDKVTEGVVGATKPGGVF